MTPDPSAAPAAANPNESTIPLLAKAYELCVPLFATLELTLACNLRCVHCYNFDRAEPAPKSRVGTPLTPAEILRAIDELADAGTLELSLSGGEALLHPHLDAFVRRARERQCAVRIKSNGVLLTPLRAHALAEAGAYAIDLSVYGASPTTHDAFTTVEGSFEKTIAGARAAIAAGLKLSLSFCLTRENAHEIEAMIALAESLPARYTLDSHITARYDGTDSSIDHRVDLATLEGLYRGPLFSALGGPACHPEKDMTCSCAKTVCAISSTGDIYPCIGAPIASGNIRNGSFADLWARSPELNRIRGLKLDDYEDCRSCPDRAFCRRSNGVVYTNTGNYTGVEAFTCQEAQLIHRIHDDVEAGRLAAPSAAEPGAMHRC